MDCTYTADSRLSRVMETGTGGRRRKDADIYHRRRRLQYFIPPADGPWYTVPPGQKKTRRRWAAALDVEAAAIRAYRGNRDRRTRK